MLVYREVDAVYRHGRSAVRVRRAMEPGELDANLAAVGEMPAAVAAWSEGNAGLDPFEVRLCDRPVQRLTEAGPGTWWVSPADCRPELERYAGRGRFDSIVVLWPSDRRVPLAGWGCTIGPGPEAGGAGFSSCVSDDWRGYPARLHPVEGFVHEWLHQVESVFRARGAGPGVFPDLHDAGHSRSCRPPAVPPHGLTYGEHESRTGTWQPWYRDLMTGTVLRSEGGCYGMDRDVWRLRGA